MTLNAPKLDDRTFDQLLADAKRLVAQKQPNWTDFNESDPGVTLLELFAFLTDTMLYRLNRLPEKSYIEFLRLLGVQLQPPTAASVELVFKRKQPDASSIDIPRGTRVSISRASGGKEPPIFITTQTGAIEPDKAEVTLLAYHCEQVEGELVGKGNGLPGQSFYIARPPIIASTGDPLDLIVAIEAMPDELEERVPAIQFQTKTYRIWREVEHFTNPGEDDHVYVVDRNYGLIKFAPAVQVKLISGDLADSAENLASVPMDGREIRVWYRRGGGVEGNVAEGKLTVLKDPIPGIVEVTNIARATGGKAAETLDNALLRGPEELHSLERAVTAKDFELIARTYSSRSVVRAKAYTQAALWAHALPGQVEVLLVPDISDSDKEHVTAEVMHSYDNEIIRTQIQNELDSRRPLGTKCIVNWANYKKVKVAAQIVIRQEEDKDALRQRIVKRLNQTITPIPTAFNSTGWAFGQALRASNVYDIALSEPGVRWVEQVRLVVEESPSQDVHSIATDFFQKDTWFAVSDQILFRSMNNGDGWEPVGSFNGSLMVVQTHPLRPGFIAISSYNADTNESRIYISGDCGETWGLGEYSMSFRVRDLAWSRRGTDELLYLATDSGLFEIVVPGGTPLLILVDQNTLDMAFYQVCSYTDPRGIVTIAVAAQEQKGIWLSNDPGVANSFKQKSKNLPASEDVRTLAIQIIGPRAYIWAGTADLTGTGGSGCYRWEIRGTVDVDPPEGWVKFNKGWSAGTCFGLAFKNSFVFAASHRRGVLTMETNNPAPQWVEPKINCGLPLRESDTERLFYPVDTVAASLSGDYVIAGGVVGAFRTIDGGQTYTESSNKEFLEKVTLPDAWLFVSDEHDIEVVGENEAG